MQRFQPKHLLVTGGAGFIGSHFITYLLDNDPEVMIINLDKLTYAGSLENLSALSDPYRHHFIQGDIGDSELVKMILRKFTVDTIVHFAAESHVDRSIKHPEDFMQTNVMGTFCLLEAARHYWLYEKQWSSQDCRFHHISTDEVYGSLGLHDPAFNEGSPYLPRSPYAASKAASDHLVRAYFNTYQLPVTLSHCSNNYGPKQHREKFIPTIIQACLQRKTIPVYGDGSNIRDWLYVEDHCRAIDLIVRRGRVGETYDIGAHHEWSNAELARYLARLMDHYLPSGKPHEELIQQVSDRPGHDLRYAIDFSKISSELGWQPHWSFENGLVHTIQCYTGKVLESTP